MCQMNEIKKMRELYFKDQLCYTEIGRIMGRDYRTVKKYCEMEELPSPRPSQLGLRVSLLDPYKPFIDGILEADQKIRFHKQRHTATRIYERLKEECGYTGGRTLVNTYVRGWKEQHLQKETYIPLAHAAGTCQVDFGTCEYTENGKSEMGRYVVAAFPHSNASFLQLCPGENLECLQEGLIAIFRHIGGVPKEIWFDNAACIVKKILPDGQRELYQGFERFQDFFGFTPVFMNPASGNEKGAVEAAVGALRRELLVPVPAFTSLEEENSMLLAQCDQRLERNHYRHDVPIKDLFADDVKNLLVLNPRVDSYDPARYATCKTDKYGKLALDGKYTYSVSPAVQSRTVQLRITSREVTVYDNDMHEIVRHRRLYGEKAESMEWIPYLKYIARKPRSLFNSGVYDMMPADMQSFVKACDNGQRGRILKMLSDLTDRSGFDSAVKTIQAAISYHATDPDSIMALYRRMYARVPVMPNINTAGTTIPDMPLISSNTDLAMLDQALQQGGKLNAHD